MERVHEHLRNTGNQEKSEKQNRKGGILESGEPVSENPPLQYSTIPLFHVMEESVYRH